jgi:hypothetical protein
VTAIVQTNQLLDPKVKYGFRGKRASLIWGESFPPSGGDRLRQRRRMYKDVMVRKCIRGLVVFKIHTPIGLINVLGYGMKYLFGIADARDVTRLTSF